jgi:hypothetical protein
VPAKDIAADEHFRRGHSALLRSDLVAAEEHFRIASHDIAYSAQSSLVLAEVLWRDGRHSEAYAHALIARAHPATRSRANVLLCELLALMGRDVEAREASLEVLAANLTTTAFRTDREKAGVAVLCGLGQGLVRVDASGNPFVSGGQNNFPELIDRNRFSPALVWVLPDRGNETFLRAIAGCPIVFNAMAEPDGQGAELAWTSEQIGGHATAIINAPTAVLRATRDHVAACAATIGGLLVPDTLRMWGLSTEDVIAWAGPRYPVLYRPAGSHGGDGLARLGAEDELRNRLSAGDGRDGYLTQFINFASDDGYYRKLRVFVIGERIIPEHCYISDHWNVHARSSRELMSQHPWMDEEAADLLRSFDRNGRTAKAIRDLGSRLGFDIFMADIGIGRDCHPVLFEANASASVILDHEFEREGLHVAPYVNEIRVALNRLLLKALGSPT